MASLRTMISLALAIAVLSVFGQSPVDSRNRPVAIRDVNVVTMEGEQILEGQTVFIENGRITSMGRNVKLKANTLEIDGKGKWLMPGLAEMHAHVPPVDDLNPMKGVLMLFAASGITTIRGMLGHPRHLELRTMLEKGEIIGPRFFTTGPSFNGMSVTSPTAGAEMVKRQKKLGYDFLKLHPGYPDKNLTPSRPLQSRSGYRSPDMCHLV